MNKILLILFSLLLFNVNAQEFADKEFYLVDSLVLEDLSEYDRILLDSILEKYHQSNDDTLKLMNISNFILTSYDINTTTKYNDLLRINALELIQKADNDFMIKKFKAYIGHYYMHKGYLSSLKGDNVEYDNYLDSSNIIFQEIGDKISIGVVMIFKAILYDESGNYSEAIDICKKGLKVLEECNDISGQQQAHYILGGVRYTIKDCSNAVISYNRSYALAEENEDIRYMGLSLMSLAQIYMAKSNNIDSAKTLILKSIEYFNTVNDFSEATQGKYILAKIALEEDSTELAKKILMENILYYKNVNESSGLSLNLYTLAEIQYENREYDLAIKNGEEAFKISEEANYTSHLEKTSSLLAEIYETIGNNGLALFYLKQNKTFNKLLFDIENKKSSINQEYEYKYEKQKEIDDIQNQQKLDLAQEQKQRTKQGLIAAAIIAGLIALFSIFIFNRLKLIRKQKAELDSAYEQLEESKKIELAVSNLKALQSQMNPHFIFNALNSVQDLVLLQDIRNSNKYLGKFSDLIRKILLSSKEQFISLEEEVEILSLYLDLEKLRFGNDFMIDLQCNVSEKQQDEIMLPAMFIQPYIENAIKHGLFHKEGKKELLVHFNIKNEALECIIQDNGIGQEKASEFKQKRLHLHTGFSTEAINERIRLLNETSEKKIELVVEDLYEGTEAVGTKIIIIFPI